MQKKPDARRIPQLLRQLRWMQARARRSRMVALALLVIDVIGTLVLVLQ